jgi:3-oxoacyl-[acyl-carrier protein] reductase
MSRLEGTAALVTGAARGIGAAIADRLALDGAAVMINFSKSSAEAQNLAQRIRARGGRAVACRADMSVPAEVRELVDAAYRAFGRLDILVNNAGAAGFAPIDDVDETLVRSQLALNVEGPMFALRAAAPYFSATTGRVINISSLAATRALAGASIYAATKAALEALTRVWAAELGPRGITVNAVAPGAVDTDMFRADEETRRHVISRTPLGRIGTPEDVADVVAFLASAEARWITGQVIETAGGMSP